MFKKRFPKSMTNIISSARYLGMDHLCWGSIGWAFLDYRIMGVAVLAAKSKHWISIHVIFLHMVLQYESCISFKKMNKDFCFCVKCVSAKVYMNFTCLQFVGFVFAGVAWLIHVDSTACSWKEEQKWPRAN